MSAAATISLRPMSTGELLDRTITLYRRHFVLFVGICAPPNLIGMAFNIAMVIAPQLAKGADAVPSAILVVGALALIPLLVGALLLTYALALAATTYAISEIYLGRVTTMGQAYNRMKFRIFRLLLIWIVIGFASLAGLVLCIIPGIWVFLRTALAVPAAVIEDLKTMPAIERSIALTKGSWVRVLLVYILVWVLQYAAIVLFQLPFMIGAAVAGDTAAGLVLQVLAQFGAALTGMAITPLAAIALALIYYDERVRKEGFDLQYMMAALDSGAPAAPGAPPAPAAPPSPPETPPPPPAPIG